jgi:hypothetical protein
MRAFYLIFLFSLLFVNIAAAQDKIIMNNGEVIHALVIEKSDKEIKFRIYDLEDSPMITMKTQKVEKIIFRNGQEMNITPDVIRMKKRFGVGAGFNFGLAEEIVFLKLEADYFITPGLKLVFNGIIEVEDGGGLALGVNYFFNPRSPRKLKGYTGILAGMMWDDFFIQTPVGINYVSKTGFDVKAGINGLSFPSHSFYTICAEFTIGWRF